MIVGHETADLQRGKRIRQTPQSRHARFVGIDLGRDAAPKLTQNQDKARDPEMHQTKKGNEWYFGMKGHVGVDSKTGLIHSAAVTPAHAYGGKLIEHLIGHLLHGKETRVWGDSGYSGQTERIKARALKALDFTNHKGCRHKSLSDEDKAKNRTKSRVRAAVEHPFLTIKVLFKFSKVCYKGLANNAHRFFVACGLANLYKARNHLMRQGRRGALAGA